MPQWPHHLNCRWAPSIFPEEQFLVQILSKRNFMLPYPLRVLALDLKKWKHVLVNNRRYLKRGWNWEIKCMYTCKTKQGTFASLIKILGIRWYYSVKLRITKVGRTRVAREHTYIIFITALFKVLNISTRCVQFNHTHFYTALQPLILQHGIEHCFIRSNCRCEDKCDVVMGAGVVRCVLTAAPWPGGWRRCPANIHTTFQEPACMDM